MKLWLDSEGITKNPKTILRIMHKYDLFERNPSQKKMAKNGRGQAQI